MIASGLQNVNYNAASSYEVHDSNIHSFIFNSRLEARHTQYITTTRNNAITILKNKCVSKTHVDKRGVQLKLYATHPTPFNNNNNNI